MLICACELEVCCVVCGFVRQCVCVHVLGRVSNSVQVSGYVRLCEDVCHCKFASCCVCLCVWKSCSR